VVQLDEAHCRQQRPALLAQAEPAAVAAGAQRHDLAARLAGGGCITRHRLLLLLLHARGDKVAGDLPHGCVPRPRATVDERRLAAPAASAQQ
jgi:hypothetical protein